MIHLECRRQHDLGGERQRTDGGGRCDGAVIDNAAHADNARGVAQERALLLAEGGLLRGPGPVGGAHAPEVLAVGLPVLRIRYRVASLRVGGPATVLEVVKTMLAHVGIANTAEI